MQRLRYINEQKENEENTDEEERAYDIALWNENEVEESD